MCARVNGQLNFLVADTRIPDHTLWQHNGLVSALSNCEQGASFLLFQIGPVQEFIKQSRKTQDLWAGSFLLSFLIAQAMLAVAKEIGPDAIVYPQLRGVPLADWFWKNEGVFPNSFPSPHHNELLTPNLPNRFLALIPKDWRKDGKSLAQIAEDAVRDAWKEIANAVHADIAAKLQDNGGAFADWDMFWQEQVARFPVMEYVVHDWLGPEESIKQAEQLATPPLKDEWQNHPLHHTVQWAREMILPEHRDARCYKHKSWKEGTVWKSELLDANGKPLPSGAPPVFENAGLVWALNYALTDWKFAARKNARSFGAWDATNLQIERGVTKDHLDGRNEVLGGPTKGLDEAHPDNPNNRFWTALRQAYGREARGGFKGIQKYATINVIKRLYPQIWLEKALGVRPPRFDSVQAIANAIDREEADAPAEKEPAYYAILCMDGDDLGQWVSGAKTPELMKVLTGTEADEKSPKGYFKKHWQPGKASGIKADAVRRPLTPSFHASLSQALGNFSLYCAGQVVEGNFDPKEKRCKGGFDGRLLYAGGDDVLAMVSAENAMDCAFALQCVFRGELPLDAPRRVREVLEGLFEFYPESPGFIRCKKAAGEGEHLRPNWPLMVMGPLATASVGIAIGHVRAPMQDTIQAARDAEHTAKAVTDKGAFCLSILKRSGESASFAAQFKRGVAGVWAELDANHDQLSGRFPYRFLHLMRPLLARPGKEGDGGWEPRWTGELIRAIEAELRHVHYQQNESGEPAERKRTNARDKASHWLGQLVGDVEHADTPHFQAALSPRDFVHFWMAWAFVNRLKEQPDINER